MSNKYNNGASSASPTSSEASDTIINQTMEGGEERRSFTIPLAEIAIDETALKQVKSAVARDRQCTLTIGDAQVVFLKHLRHALSKRRLQTLCQERKILAEKLTGEATEWLINEPSLLEFIEKRPVSLTEAAAEIMLRKTLKLEIEGGAGGGNSAGGTSAVHGQQTPVAPAAPADGEEYADISEIGDQRKLGELLLKNAELAARLAGKEEVIGNLKDHDQFMRDALRRSSKSANQATSHVVAIAAQMLDTMKAIGTARVALEIHRDASNPKLVSSENHAGSETTEAKRGIFKRLLGQ